MKKIVVSVINDLSTDQRVHRHCDTLVKLGYEVLLVGRKLPNSLPLKERSYSTKRMNLLFKRGALFYAEYNLRLFFFLMFNRFDGLLSNDLDTLLANFLAAKLKRKPLVYDSHEYFLEVPELMERPAVKKVWGFIERFIFPKLDYVFTVNDSIANLYHSQYGNKVGIVRNLPFKKNIPTITRKELGLPEDKKIILLQGAGINKDRGAEEIVEAMYFMHSDQVIFLIIGSGDVIPELEDKIWRHGLSDKVFLKGKMPMDELIKYTSVADLGVSMDKDTNLNYRYSLPNKLFDYIQCGVPVFASNLIEVRKVIEDYSVGYIASNHEPSYLGNRFLEIFEDEATLNLYKENAKKAAEELCWENEKVKFEQIISNAFQS